MLQKTHTRETRDSAREVKFLVPAHQAADVLDWGRSRLSADPHAGGPSGDEYRTTTVYFDTHDRAVYERRGSYGRSKYRIRRYGASDVAFLERKLRTRHLLSKRRSAIATGDLAGLLASAHAPGPWGWFLNRVATRQLLPACQVSYRRHALVGAGPYGPMRLTFDDEIRTQLNTTTVFAPDGGIPVIEGHVIIEMKFCVDTPAVMKHLVEQFQLSPAPISKYRLSIGELTGLAPDAAVEALRRSSGSTALPGGVSGFAVA